MNRLDKYRGCLLGPNQWSAAVWELFGCSSRIHCSSTISPPF